VFEGPIRRTIHRYKYRGEFARAASLVDLVHRDLKLRDDGSVDRWDRVAFVPLHPSRRRQRGFDQAQLLAGELSRRLSVQLTSGLTRVVDTRSQVGLNASEREANVRDAFRWVDADLAGDAILLVDDVVTTGATMNAVAFELKRVGAGRVDGVSIARQSLSAPDS
jgi:ComF family protein